MTGNRRSLPNRHEKVTIDLEQSRLHAPGSTLTPLQLQEINKDQPLMGSSIQLQCALEMGTKALALRYSITEDAYIYVDQYRIYPKYPMLCLAIFP
jgi:hypothetical protein